MTQKQILEGVVWSVSVLALGLSGGPARGADAQAPTASGFAALVQQGDAADARLDTNGALKLYLEADAEHPNDPQILVKVAKEFSDSTLAITDADENRRRIGKALDYSKRAVDLDPHNAVAQLSVAVCYGKLGLYSDTREKIGYVRLIKEYAERALAADPGYAYAYHVLGQWEYEVASLGRTKRFLVELIYGGLPAASTEEGVRHLERAVELEPNTASHRLALGFAYLANGEPIKARKFFEQVMAMPCRELYDADCHKQAEAAIANL
jgi:tetratricopeptide (TPR) repeat protein